MFKKKNADIIYRILLILLITYFLFVMLINFSFKPEFYETDMYSDILFSQNARQELTLFPENWVFGNQFYVVATPVVSAFFCFFIENPAIAMSIASSLMATGVLLSYNWMLKALFPDRKNRLPAIVTFLSMMLLCGDAYQKANGWNLLFTMCSYYACYAITAFCGFGCFLRSDRQWSWKEYCILVFTCLMSFGTGMQSLRQTLIMVCPMLFTAAVILFFRSIKKEHWYHSCLPITGIITISNLLGVCVIKWMNIQQIQIYGNLNLQPLDRIFSRILPSIYKATSLYATDIPLVSTLIKIILIPSVIFLLYRAFTLRKNHDLLLLLLFGSGIAALLVINIFTTMEIREIYYFMLYPMTGFLFTLVFTNRKIGQYTVSLLLCIIFAVNLVNHLLPLVQDSREATPYQTVSDYLEEEGRTTVYTDWNQGEKIAIASDCRIRAGFWNAGPFIPTRYLCNSDIFEADPRHCAYFFASSEAAAAGEAYAEACHLPLQLLRYFPEYDFYLYVSDENLMH